MSRRKRLLKKALEPRLEEAQNGTRTVFFVDAAHFVLTAYLGFLWCFVRQFIRAPAGRQRFNVLGALNAVTHELIMVTNDTYINAGSVCELLHRIAALASPCPSPSFLTTPVIKNVGWSGILPSPLASSFFSCRLIPPISTSSSGFGSSSKNSASIRSTTTTSPSSNRPSPLALLKPTPSTRSLSIPSSPSVSRHSQNHRS